MYHQLGRIESWFRFIAREGLHHKRWGEMRQSNPESVLEHMIKQYLITVISIHLEEHHKSGSIKDPYDFLNRCFTHDFDELLDGDDVVHRKNESKHSSDEKARKSFWQVISSGIPDGLLRRTFKLPHNLDEMSSPEDKEFWNALENVGYALFALEEVRIAMQKYCTPEFDPSLVKEWDSVIFYALSNLTTKTQEEFISIRI